MGCVCACVFIVASAKKKKEYSPPSPILPSTCLQKKKRYKIWSYNGELFVEQKFDQPDKLFQVRQVFFLLHGESPCNEFWFSELCQVR